MGRREEGFLEESRFTPLLVSLVAYLFVLGPFTSAGAVRTLAADIILSITLIASIMAVARTRRVLYWITGVVAVILLLSWWAHFNPSPVIRVFSAAALGVGALAATVMVFRQVLAKGPVTHQKIQGAVCGYLLLGFIWSCLYLLVAMKNPEAFRGLEVQGSFQVDSFVYFSFVTLTTLGFGDVTPVSEAVRSLTMLEALSGQFYLAILVARLVALYSRDEAL